MATDDAVKAAMEELYKSLSIDGIIGEPIEMGDKVIIPIAKMGVVFGTGLHFGARDNRSYCNAAGGGGIFPVAVVVISRGIKGPEGLRVLPLARPSAKIELAESLSQMASAVISRLNVSETSRNNEPQHSPHTAELEIK